MTENTACRHPAWPVGAIGLLAMIAVSFGFSRQLPVALWPQVILHRNLDDIRQLLVVYSFLPRVVTALLCGMGLSLAGVIFQQVMRNPLAEPTTLGVSAGASLALALVLAFAPDLLSYGREWVALIGAVLASLAVFGLAWGRGLAPLALILAGLIVGLYCGAVSAGIELFENPYMQSFYLWGTGSLSQQDWTIVYYLFPRLAVAGVLVALMVRPLTILSLEDEGARSLGLSLFGVRLIALVIAVSLSAFVVSAVGIVGFIGLAAPALVRLAGARRFSQQLIWAPLLGAALLCLADQFVQLAFPNGRELVPTGVATSLLGAPLLLWMLPRMRGAGEPFRARAGEIARRASHPTTLVIGAILLLAVGVVISLHLGQNGYGWHWSTWTELQPILQWRAPRMLGSLAAGAMLAVAGALMQRVTGNPMASPEILGIGGGAALGMILLVMLSPSFDRATQLAACTIGAFSMLGIILLSGRKTAYAPTRTLLAGIALGALTGVLSVIFMASGGPRVTVLKSWMAGATNLITWPVALFACATATVLVALAPLVRRSLEILPLGADMPRALGVDLSRSRLTILMLVALLTAGAVLTIGPLGFVGLMGPHLARMMGLQRPLPHLLGSAALGALIMVAADWLGRTVMFPYQVPAGLVATLIGGPYLMVLLRKRAA